MTVHPKIFLGLLALNRGGLARRCGSKLAGCQFAAGLAREHLEAKYAEHCGRKGNGNQNRDHDRKGSHGSHQA